MRQRYSLIIANCYRQSPVHIVSQVPHIVLDNKDEVQRHVNMYYNTVNIGYSKFTNSRIASINGLFSVHTRGIEQWLNSQTQLVCCALPTDIADVI